MKVPAGTWNRLAQWVTVFLLSLSLGWQWATLQSVAWAGMLVERTRATSFQEAWRTTFDGQHPCRLCRLVRGAVTQDQHPLNKATDEVRPLDLIGMMLCSVTAPSVQTPRPELPADWVWVARSDPPHLPPPRHGYAS